LERKAHWLQPGVGHYGVFNGSRFRAEIVPRIADFVLSNTGASRTRRMRSDGGRVSGNGSTNAQLKSDPGVNAQPNGPAPAQLRPSNLN
jgi:hypothetical protein